MQGRQRSCNCRICQSKQGAGESGRGAAAASAGGRPLERWRMRLLRAVARAPRLCSSPCSAYVTTQPLCAASAAAPAAVAAQRMRRRRRRTSCAAQRSSRCGGAEMARGMSSSSSSPATFWFKSRLRKQAARAGGMVSGGGPRPLASTAGCSGHPPVGTEVAAWPPVLPGRLAEHRLPPPAPCWLPFKRSWLLHVLVQRLRCSCVVRERRHQHFIRLLRPAHH